MSYDIFIFRPKSGVSPEWINRFLESEEANDENADPEDIEARYIDMDIDRDELSALVAAPLIYALSNQEFTQEEIDSYLEDPEFGTELSDCMDMALEYHEGHQIMAAITYGERGIEDRLWEAFEELYHRGLLVHDPQVGRVLDMRDDREEFVETFKECCETFDDDITDMENSYEDDLDDDIE